MSHKDKHIRSPLSQEVLLAYLEGSLTPIEKEAVDKIIEQEPHYAEVLEGLRWVDESYPFAERMKALQQTVQSRPTSSTKSVIPIHRYIRWVAAAIVLTAIVTAGLWITGQLSQQEPVLAEQLQPSKRLPTPDIQLDSAKSAASASDPAPPPPPIASAPIEVLEDAVVVMDAEEMDAEEITDWEDAALPADEPEAETMPEIAAATTRETIQSANTMSVPADQGTLQNLHKQTTAPVADNYSAAPVRYAQAWKAYHNQQYQKAIRLATSGISQQPTQEGYWLLAQAHLAQSDTILTIQALEEALLLAGPYTDTVQQQLVLFRQ